MTFNTALTGLRAATSELNVSGNNIANASTVGFKQSRVEFADVYANSVTGGGSSAVGNGVRVADVSQQFSQGNISFTENALDLAINGGGYFVVNDNGSQSFTRAGQFGVDDEGFISTNEGALLQGFPANSAGLISGVIGDLQLDSASIPPRATTVVTTEFNVSADEAVPEIRTNLTLSNGTGVGVVQVGTTNGYSAGTIDIDGVAQNVPSAANLSANVIAGELSAIDGVTASAVTSTDISIGAGLPLTGAAFTINLRPITGTTSAEVATSINSLAGFSAIETGGVITVTSNAGEDLDFRVTGAGVSVDVGVGTASVSTIDIGTPDATVGGTINVTLDEGVTFENAIPAVALGAVFDGTPPITEDVANQFDPTDQNTYNHATSGVVFDSLGAPHTVTQFFVKQSSVVNPPNTWSMYIQIDGLDVGDADPADPLQLPTLAEYALRFNNDGTLDTVNSDPIDITNWVPNEAPDAQGPPESNFSFDITGSTQFSGEFEVSVRDQDGFSSGQLTGVDISEEGVIFARYSNGEALVLGQLALADFPNEQGLTPLGNTSWAESFESGEPVIGTPRTASLGAIQSGALEDSNVELAEELVALIIAQRNFQANSRTIETANEITQTIINLR